MYMCASPSYLERYGRPHSLSELRPAQLSDWQFRIWQLQQDGREFSQRVQGAQRATVGRLYWMLRYRV